MNASVPEQQPLSTAANGGRSETGGSEAPRAHYLDPAEADRYALAYRPSWHGSYPKPTLETTAPLAQEPIATLHIPGKRSHRASVIALVSVVGFCVLAYWGVRSGGAWESHARPPSQAVARATSVAPSTDLTSAPSSDLAAAAGAAEEVPPSPETPLAAQTVSTSVAASAPSPGASSADQTTSASKLTATAAPATGSPDTTRQAPSAAETAAQRPRRVRQPLVFVRTVPEGARVWFDGRRMTSPFDVTVPRGTMHTIEARSDGYENSSQTLRIESDMRITVTLRRAIALPRAAQARKPLEPHARRPGVPAKNALR